MKICPKCHSSYADETLNFCLTDGETLILSEFHDSRDYGFTEDETIRDPNFHIPNSAAHETIPSNSSATLPFFNSKTTAFQPDTAVKPRGNMLSIILAALFGAGAIWGAFWYFGPRENNIPVIIKDPGAESRPVANLPEEQKKQITKEVSELITSWYGAINKRDINGHIEHYKNILTFYYKESGIDRNHVKADRQRAFDKYPSIEIKIDNVKIFPESSEAVAATFDKSWTFKNSEKVSTGTVLQELHIVKQGGKWIIDGEKDVQVYNLNNRNIGDEAK